MSTPKTTILTRRALAGVSTVGLALPLLTACGEDGTSPSSTGDPETTATGSGSPTSETTTGAPEGPAGRVSIADVPVGSGVILPDEQVVVTQPAPGEFKAFSAVCPHTGCTVTGISDIITCPCHGSTFDITTGDVLGGPAPNGLAAVDFTVESDTVVLS